MGLHDSLGKGSIFGFNRVTVENPTCDHDRQTKKSRQAHGAFRNIN